MAAARDVPSLHARGARTPTLIFTLGHGARPLDAFLDLLRSAGVTRLIDVRSAPGSRKHPQFGREALAAALLDAGIEYEWRREFGGWRKTNPGSRHVALRSPGFRGYADHMESEEFQTALRWLIGSSRRVRTAVMCAESLWWRCHRRMLADALSAAGCDVVHIMEGGRLEPHRLSPAVRVEGSTLVYDREAPPESPRRT